MAEANVNDSDSTVRVVDQDRAIGIALEATYEMESLLYAAKQAFDNSEMVEHILRGLLARMYQLNSATMSALGDDSHDLNELEHVVFNAGIGAPGLKVPEQPALGSH